MAENCPISMENNIAKPRIRVYLFFFTAKIVCDLSTCVYDFKETNLKKKRVAVEGLSFDWKMVCWYTSSYIACFSLTHTLSFSLSVCMCSCVIFTIHVHTSKLRKCIV